MTKPFAIKDCALLAIATGDRAQNLRELRDRLRNVHPGCIYYHFWGGLLRPRFDDPEFRNDFAAWARHGLHDHTMAERLAIINPMDQPDLEQLRDRLLDAVEERLDEVERVHWSSVDQQFHFIRSQIVVFDTKLRIDSPDKLKTVVPGMSASSIFYHFIDARRRVPGQMDDFSAWLSGQKEDYTALIDDLSDIDPYFGSLADLRIELFLIFEEHL